MSSGAKEVAQAHRQGDPSVVDKADTTCIEKKCECHANVAEESPTHSGNGKRARTSARSRLVVAGYSCNRFGTTSLTSSLFVPSSFGLTWSFGLIDFSSGWKQRQ
mmetsp:Transcript_21406/g.42505  ORF Transcript_21406/g.42505 Transcript_21406/m.42505 type:complete len:105 (+) Transcript_21406:880-1194(+)